MAPTTASTRSRCRNPSDTSTPRRRRSSVHPRHDLIGDDRSLVVAAADVARARRRTMHPDSPAFCTRARLFLNRSVASSPLVLDISQSALLEVHASSQQPSHQRLRRTPLDSFSALYLLASANAVVSNINSILEHIPRSNTSNFHGVLTTVAIFLAITHCAELTFENLWRYIEPVRPLLTRQALQSMLSDSPAFVQSHMQIATGLSGEVRDAACLQNAYSPEPFHLEQRTRACRETLYLLCRRS